MPRRLTDKLAKAAPRPPRGSRIVYDTVVKGFGLRVTAAGSRAFVLNYRCKADGRERRYTIGSFPDWGSGAARDEARRLKRAIDGGADPVGEQRATRAAPTVTDLCDRFIKDHLTPLRPATAHAYRRQLEEIIKPHLGQLKVAGVTFADVQDMHRRISRERGPYAANRVITLLGRLFNLAVRWQWRADNPAKGVERNRESRRQRYLSNAELARLMAALAAEPDRQAANVFRLLLLTGSRKSEVLGAKWADLDLEAGVWTKLGATTKQKTEHRVPLSGPARASEPGISRV
jgi:hypothetical protein